MCLGAQMNLLIETVLLSTHNMRFGQKKIIKFSLRTLNQSPGKVTKVV